VTYRITWQSKGERVFGKSHTKPLAAVEVIAALDLDRFVWKQGDVEVQPEPAKAEEPKREEPPAKRPRTRRQKATAAA
jgi:hypothetical protein